MKNLHNGLKVSSDLACSVFSQIWFSHLPPLFPLLQSQWPPHLSLNRRLFCTRDVALAAAPAGHALLPMALRIRSCPSLHLCSNVTFSVRLLWHPYLICKIILPASAFPIHSTGFYFFPILSNHLLTYYVIHYLLFMVHLPYWNESSTKTEAFVCFVQYSIPSCGTC